MQPETVQLITAGNMKKGDVLTVAELAGVMAAKKTSDLVPLCHPLPLTHVAIDFEIDSEHSLIHASCRAETRGQTGIEIEALCAVQTALLTIYDMCKAVDRGMEVTDIALLRKEGGQSGNWSREGGEQGEC